MVTHPGELPSRLTALHTTINTGTNRGRWNTTAAVVGRLTGQPSPDRLDDAITVPIPTRIPPPNPTPPTARPVARIDPRAVVARIQAGDRAAFGLLYDHYFDTVFRFVYFRVGNRQLAEDLTATTFLRALKRIDSFTWQAGGFVALLVTIARRLIADEYKSARHRLEVTTWDVLDDDRVDIDPETPETTVVDRDTRRILLAAIRQLTTEQQEVIALRFLHGFTVPETAQAMDKGVLAVKALQYRALRNLARLLPKGLWP